ADAVVYLRQRRATEAVLAAAQVDKDQVGVALVDAQLRGQGAADVLHRRKAGHDQGHGRGDALVLAFIIPAGLHGHGILADRNGDTQLRAQLHADSLDGVVQARVFTGVAGGGHPVGGQADIRQFVDPRGSQVGNGFGNGHAAGRRGVEQRQRRALTHSHGFTGVHVVTGGGHGAISDRYLPGADHLVAGDQAGDAAITNGDQEVLAGHSRQAQHTQCGFFQLDAGGVEVIALLCFPADAAVHARRLAEQHRQRHVDWLVVEVTVVEHQQLFFSGFTDYGEGATLALADGLEALEVGVRHGHDVAFLGFVGPDFQRAHARLVIGDVAQLEAATAATIVDQFREGVGQPACAHVVDKGDGVLFAQLPAAVDDLLAAAFHFRVLALHRGEVQVFSTAAGGHGRGGTAAQTDEHGRAAQYHQFGPDRDLVLLDVLGADVAQAAGDHDRLVVATDFRATGRGYGLLEGAEVASQRRTAELVVERGAAERAVDHDLQRGHNAARLAVVLFPGLFEAGDAQVGYGKAGQAGLGLAAATGGAFVADLTTGAGGGAGK